jgi:hypothetical protein
MCESPTAVVAFATPYSPASLGFFCCGRGGGGLCPVVVGCLFCVLVAADGLVGSWAKAYCCFVNAPLAFSMNPTFLHISQRTDTTLGVC